MSSWAQKLARLVTGGLVSTDESRDLAGRLRELHDQLFNEVIAPAHEPWTQAETLVVVETPAATKRPPATGSFKRSVMSLPTYGAAVGACILAAHTARRRVLTVPSDRWARAVSAPGTKGDEHKEARQRYVCELWALDGLGAVSVGGNVADAALLSLWGATRDRDMLHRVRYVVGLDPSISATGWAVLEILDHGDN